MGIEGAVNLALKKQLAALETPEEREQMFQMAVAYAYDRGKAISTASFLEIDGVIDPADTRKWILRALTSVPEPGPRKAMLDTW
jgi:acetyl-CoA carboxylase carboxyltransferase component